MFKLLTEEARKKVESEYIMRRGVVVLTALIVIVIAGMIGLFPSYIVSNAQQKEVQEHIEPVESLELQKDYSPLYYWLDGMKFRIGALDPSSDKERAASFIESVLKERISGIKVTELLWSKFEKKPVLSLSGIAHDRQALLAFEERLNSSGKFSSVTLPVSNLAKDKNISFKLKLSPKAP